MNIGSLIKALAALGYPARYVPPGGEGGTAGVTSVNGRAGTVTLDKADVNLGNVDNTSDMNKPVSTAQAAADQAVLDAAAADATGKANAAQAAAIAAIPTSTDGLPEGTNPARFYFSGARAIASLLTGFSAATATVVTASDSIVVGIGKLQGQITAAANALAQNVRDTVLTGLSVVTATAVTATDTVLTGIGKLQAQITAAINNIPQNVRDTVLTGLSLATATAITATDTVLSAFGKLQAQITAAATNFADNVRATLLTGFTASPSSAVTAADSILIAIGKLQAQLNTATTGLANSVRGTVLTGLSLASDAVITASSTVLQAFGQLQAQITARLIRRETGGTDLSLGSIPDGAFLRRSGTDLVGDSAAAVGDATTAEMLAIDPAATANVGRMLRISDIGVGNNFFVASGGYWRPVNGTALLMVSAGDTDIAIPADGAANFYDVPGSAVTFPGKLLTPTGRVKVYSEFQFPDDAVTTDTVQLVINDGTTDIAVMNYSVSSSLETFNGEWSWGNRGSLTSQEPGNSGAGGSGFGNTSTNFPGTSFVQTTINTETATLTVKLKVRGPASTTIRRRRVAITLEA